jgi:hypothetical protein
LASMSSITIETTTLVKMATLAMIAVMVRALCL